MSSHDHKVVAMSDQEVWQNQPTPVPSDPGRLRGHCNDRSCREHVTCWVSYRYVTGRAGRTTTARKAVCRKHAIRFALKHGVVVGSPTGKPPMTRGGGFANQEEP